MSSLLTHNCPSRETTCRWSSNHSMVCLDGQLCVKRRPLSQLGRVQMNLALPSLLQNLTDGLILSRLSIDYASISLHSFSVLLRKRTKETITLLQNLAFRLKIRIFVTELYAYA